MKYLGLEGLTYLCNKIKDALSGYVKSETGKGLSSNDFTDSHKTKLEGLQNYTHPSTHPASMITQDTTHRFITDTEKATYNAKLSSTGDGSNLTANFTESSSFANIVTGEKMSVILGKIKKAISSLISHSALAASTTMAGHVKFGTAAGTACQGNDIRLSDARTPKSHTHDDRYYTESEVDSKFANIPTDETLSEAGKPADAAKVGTELSNVTGEVRDLARNFGAHDHDGFYYRKSEVDSKLTGYLSKAGGDLNTGACITLHDTDLSTCISIKGNEGRTDIYADSIMSPSLHGDTAGSTVTFVNGDSINPTAWTDVQLLNVNTEHRSMFNKISIMFKNVRYLYNQITTINSNLGKKLTDNKGTIGISPWASKNFNDYGSVTGSWSCGTPADCTNCPVTETGVLSAFNGGTYVSQIYTTATHMYHRIYTATVWRPWTVYYSQKEINDLLKYRPQSSGQNYIIAADSIIVTVTTSNSSNNSDGKRTFFNTIINTASKGFTSTPFFATATISGKQCGISYNYDNSNNAGIALSFWLPYQVVNTPIFTVGENIRISWLAIGN